MSTFLLFTSDLGFIQRGGLPVELVFMELVASGNHWFLVLLWPVTFYTEDIFTRHHLAHAVDSMSLIRPYS